MGIDFSHGEAHWAYSGFMRFRSLLAETLGYTTPLTEMYDNGTYDIMKKEPIYPLINHSDCDGELTVAEMKQILPQLIKIVDIWKEQPEDSAGKFEINRTNAFIDGMEEAVAADESFEFW